MAKKAIVLLNMGGPNDLNEVKIFLKNMFTDKYIIRTKSPLLRWFIAQMITFFRTKKSQNMYRQIGGKSPIVEHTKALCEKLQRRIGPEFSVEFAMRYTPPFADSVCQKLSREGVDEIILLPMYPQYSTTTTQSSIDDFKDAMHRHALSSSRLYVIEPFYQQKLYNKCLIERILEQINTDEALRYELIFSAHGLPEEIDDADGKIYSESVRKQIDLISHMMAERGIRFKNIHLAYQSKLGPMKWLEPALDSVLRQLDHKKALIVPIAFTIDNSETDYELSIEYAELAHELGFESYKVSRCPNDHPLFVESIISMIEDVSAQ